MGSLSAAMTTNDVYVDAFKYTMCWVLGHFAISLPLKLVYGDKRSEAMVMGGAGNDTKGKDGTKLTHLLAYNGVTVVYQCFCAYYGTMGWYVTGDAASIGGSAQDRLYGTTSISQMLVVATASFELYNSVSVMLMPEYCNAAFVGHHWTTLLLATLGLHPFLHYYGFFFFGLSAISSVPLALVEVANLAGFPSLVEVFQIAFAITFLIFRTCYWPVVSYQFWSDSLEAMNTNKVHSEFAYGTFLVANIGLTGLQWFWTTKILGGIANKLNGEKAHDLNKKD